jgi:hypothetical protein
MSAYATQFPALSFGGRGMLADPEIHRYEVSWELGAGADAHSGGGVSARVEEQTL